MAALVDYTALAPATGWTDTFPVCAATPVDGIAKDFWRKVRVDFSLTNLANDSWAKIMTIPAHTYVFEIMTYISTIDGAQNIVMGDAATDASNTWRAAIAVGVADITTITLVADTNGATRGKYYHAAGGIYISPAAVDLDTLVIDVYVHCMTLDPL